MNKQLKMVEVYRANSEMEALVIKSLLESYQIPCLLKSHAAPSVHVFTSDGMGEVKIMVAEGQSEKARGLIEKKEDV